LKLGRFRRLNYAIKRSAGNLRELTALASRSVQVIRQEGLGSFLRRATFKIRMRQFRIVQPATGTTDHLVGLRDLDFSSQFQRNRALRPTPSATSQTRKFGVNFAGYFTGQFGGAASSRAFAKSLELAAVPHVLNKLVGGLHGEKRKTRSAFSSGSPYAINLIHVNPPDIAEAFVQSVDGSYLRGRYNIGVWYWELSRLPNSWISSFGLYDEIWATSSFTAGCLSRVSPIPVVKVRYPLCVNETLIDRRARGRFHLEEDVFVFYFLFDFLSLFERKNPLALLKAFGRAFRRNEKALFLLQHINSKLASTHAKRLEEESSDLNVRIVKGHLSERDYLSLLAACDCYVSLHRSEGLGLPLAEAMYLGKPVIATAYSGNMDFMNVNNSLLVKYELKQLDRDYGPYEKGNVWAEPDIGHAAELMRWVYENRDEATKLGERASRDIRESMNLTLASREIMERLKLIYERR